MDAAQERRDRELPLAILDADVHRIGHAGRASAVGDLGERLGERRGTAGGVDVAVAALGPLERLTRLLEPARASEASIDSASTASPTSTTARFWRTWT